MLNHTLDAALSYSTRKWAVFPVHTVLAGQCSCGSSSCRHPGKHPCTRHGVRDATVDADQIRKMWQRCPTASVGIAMGGTSGLLAIDIDARNGGNENLYDLERTYGELPTTLTSLTGGGGSHLLFQYVGGVKNQVGRIAPGIDVKSDGGYIIAPPSMHHSGNRYRWAEGYAPEDIDAAVCPGWLLKLLRNCASSLNSATANVHSGQRNDYLTSFAGSMRRRGLDVSEIDACLQHINARRCAPPLEAHEVQSIANSISRYPVIANGHFDHGGDHSATAREPGSMSGYEPNQWPDPLAESAFFGLAGQLIELVGPHCEADPAALLIQFLVQFGNVIGRRAHFTVGADKHFANLFAVLVGTTSKGRKGTSEGVVRSVLEQADRAWASDRIMNGLSSGEGLIWQVRDAIESHEPIREKGAIKEYQTVISDKGVADKRLLIVEPEFASVLQVCERETNTLSAIIRQAWDRGDLRSLTKKTVAKATAAHVSIVGHVTREELHRYLTDTAAVNGFANRFLWVSVRRSKVLPDGGELSKVDFSDFRRDLAEAVTLARKAGEMARNGEAREMWHAVYPELSEGKPGLLGAAISRAEAQVMRLALIYALLDCSSLIRKEHLSPALAVWTYCEQSARFLFGNALGDPTADEILRELRKRDDGMTRLEIRDLFSRHKSSSEIFRALTLLAEQGMARFVKEETGGRPTERWALLTSAQKATKAIKAPSDDTAQTALYAR